MAVYLFGDVSLVCDGDEQDAPARMPADANSPDVEPPDDPAGHAHPHADPQAKPDRDAAAVGRSGDQEQAKLVVTGSGSTARADAQGEHGARACAQNEVRGPDAEPPSRRTPPVDRRPRDVDGDPLRSGIAQLDPPRRGRDERDPRRGDGERHRGREDHRATTVNVTVAA
jgi:hypothetical protein